MVKFEKFQLLFQEHPASCNESYIQHLINAALFGAKLVIAGIACIVHAILPFLFVDTASTQVISRDRHASYVKTIALIGSSLDRFATEKRNQNKDPRILTLRSKRMPRIYLVMFLS